ncbi:IS66 family insertion sequence element accessory protein TnpB [Pseudomonas jessenii]|uniref:IS66 family insertion sequence element accessory protein TnpB n=1 Tax=Pseudomonas jessenii TaxID=77298 RepID=UPI003D80BD84
MGFRKSIDGLAAPGEAEYQGSSVPPSVFCVPQQASQLGEERNGSFLWLKRLEPEHFKTSPDLTDETIVLSTQEFNGVLDDLIIGAAIRLRF